MISRIADKYSVSYAGCQIFLVSEMFNTPGLKNSHSPQGQTKVPYFGSFMREKPWSFRQV